jgi:DNA-binding CsgD family transcriptional regulator
MVQDNPDRMIDRMYEAALIPDKWPQILDDLSAVAGAVGATLISSDMNDFRYIASPGFGGFMADFLAGGWTQHNTRLPALLNARHAGFVIEEDVFTPDEIENNKMIREFLRPRDLGWATATAFTVPTGDTLVVTIERRFDKGPVPRSAVAALDGLRPHLGRAALMSARLQLERVKATVTALNLLGLPAAVLSRSHRVVAANDLLEALIPRVLTDRRERVTLADPQADRLLLKALARPHRGTPLSVPVAAQGRDPALVVHLVPVLGDACDVFVNAAFVLVVTPVEPAKVTDAEVIQALFDLTASEARVARGIAQGATVDELAQRHGVSAGTIRNQMKAVFAKTGVSRQVDLVRLLGGLSLRV